MRRPFIAVAWMIGATVPLLVATVFLVGCCVLPFHEVAHKLMPICHVATDLLRGDVGDPDDAQQPTPAREKQEPVKRLVTTTPAIFRFIAAPAAHQFDVSGTAVYRSFITLGAVRCDQDVGLHLLVETFLI